MEKRRIEIKKIEDNANRRVTFCRRRPGLFKMATELGEKHDAEVAVIARSASGNAFAFGHPSVDSIVKRYKETKKAEASAAKRDNDVQQGVQNLPEDDFDEAEESPDDDDDQEMSDYVMEVNKDKLLSEKRNGDQEEVHRLAENDDKSEIEESLDVDQGMPDHGMEVKKGKSSSEKRTEDQQELHGLPEDDDGDEYDDEKNTMSDQLDLSLTLSLPLPLRNSAEKEDNSAGMMIKQKSESGKSLAISLPAGGSQKNATTQEVQDKGNVVKKQGNSIANSIMMPILFGDVPLAEDLESHELQEIITQMEEMKKKVEDRVNQIRKSHADSSGHLVTAIKMKAAKMENSLGVLSLNPFVVLIVGKHVDRRLFAFLN